MSWVFFMVRGIIGSERIFSVEKPEGRYTAHFNLGLRQDLTGKWLFLMGQHVLLIRALWR